MLKILATFFGSFLLDSIHHVTHFLLFLITWASQLGHVDWQQQLQCVRVNLTASVILLATVGGDRRALKTAANRQPRMTDHEAPLIDPTNQLPESIGFIIPAFNQPVGLLSARSIITGQ